VVDIYAEMFVDKQLRNSISQPTPAPVGQRLCRSAQARFVRNGAIKQMSLASPAAAAEPIR